MCNCANILLYHSQVCNNNVESNWVTAVDAACMHYMNKGIYGL